MEWSDDAIVLNVKPHGESSAILEVLTRAHGRHAGLVRGGASRKSKAALQPGNSVHLVWRARLNEHLGNFAVEPSRSRAGHIIEHRDALAGLNAFSAVTIAALPERETHQSVFEAGEFLLDGIADADFAHWAPLYVRWEAGLLDELGFGLDFSECAATGETDDLAFVSPRSGRAVSRAAAAPYKERMLPLPPFLLGSQAGEPTPDDIRAGLRLTAYFLLERVLQPHGKTLPTARLRLEEFASREIGLENDMAKQPPAPIADDIRPEPLADALSQRYLAYALSTITQRALPDARDGLKPVHRRILYGMRLLRLDPNGSFKKSAKIVGDVMGSYHPHGDQAIYDALVRLAQDFSSRYPLIDGQGNFGNVDGDNAAAMRYTEARMTEIAQALLEGLDEDAVDFKPNYDGAEREPVVMPAAFPNLLANGSSGIAVGMATNIPPHNLGELCGALKALIENPNTREATLLNYVKGPDFPTGGIIVEDPANMAEAYRTGRGGFRVRARWKKEDSGRGTYQIVVTEIPYQVQKAKLIERIAELIELKKLPLLDDVRDESAEDIRLVLIPKSRTAEPEILMEQLFRQSDLETRISLNMNVLDSGLIPRVMSLKDALQAFINHRRDVLERRSKHRLEKIAARLDILEGYLIVYLDLDKVIKIIRTEDEPKPKLIKAFSLTETQAEAILNMRLRSLRKLEEMEIRREHENLTKEQKELKKLLGSEDLKNKTLIDEVKEIDTKFGLKTALGKRRTEIANAALVEKMSALAEEVTTIENTVEKEPITIVCSEKGWLRSLKGHQEKSDAVKYREGDRERFWIHAETTDKLMIFATDGRFFTLDCAKLPGGRGNGEAIRTFIDMPPEADVVTMFPQKGARKLLLASTTGHGFIVGEDDCIAQTKSGKRVMNVKSGAEAAVCRFVDGDSVACVGDNRKLLIFPLAELPEMAKGQGNYLQRFKDGGLLDATTFTWKAGLKDQNNREFTPSELKEWKGERAQAGRIVPRGWAKSGKFAS